jgi:hypothetical protein
MNMRQVLAAIAGIGVALVIYYTRFVLPMA